MTEFLTVIISVSLSGVVAVWLTYMLNTKYQKKELYRIKLEEIYISFNQWSKYVFGTHNYLFPLFNSEITYNQYLDKFIETGKSFDSLYPEKMKMAITFYHPYLEQNLKRVEAVLSELNLLREKFKLEYTRGSSNSINYPETLRELMKELATAINEMSQAIKNASMKI